jgi:hypothetical protein
VALGGCRVWFRRLLRFGALKQTLKSNSFLDALFRTHFFGRIFSDADRVLLGKLATKPTNSIIVLSP